MVNFFYHRVPCVLSTLRTFVIALLKFSERLNFLSFTCVLIEIVDQDFAGRICLLNQVHVFLQKFVVGINALALAIKAERYLILAQGVVHCAQTQPEIGVLWV